MDDDHDNRLSRVRVLAGSGLSANEAENAEYERNLVKVAVAGDSACGKTSILRWLQLGECCVKVRATVAVDMVILRLHYPTGRRAKVVLYDMVGDDRFRPYQRCNMFGGIEGVMMVFDTKRPETFRSLAIWERRLDLDNDEQRYRKVVCANKSDLISDTARRSELALSWSSDARTEHSAKYFWTSAKSGENCVESLAYLVDRILRDRAKKEIIEHRNMRLELGMPKEGLAERRSKRCCS